MGFHFRSAGRVRSLFAPFSERAALGGAECRHTETSQDSYADSSRAGQFYNSVGYLGVSPPYGTFRQNALTLDAVFAYDSMGASYAFSPLGWQGLTCGAGNTETCRHSTALKYRVDIDQFRLAALWQFDGYELNNAATGTHQLRRYQPRRRQTRRDRQPRAERRGDRACRQHAAGGAAAGSHRHAF
jgi:hypothetical protein